MAKNPIAKSSYYTMSIFLAKNIGDTPKIGKTHWFIWVLFEMMSFECVFTKLIYAFVYYLIDFETYFKWDIFIRLKYSVSEIEEFPKQFRCGKMCKNFKWQYIFYCLFIFVVESTLSSHFLFFSIYLLFVPWWGLPEFFAKCIVCSHLKCMLNGE